MADFATVIRLIVSGDSQGAVAALEEVQAATGATAAKSEAANAAVATQTASMGKMAAAAGVGFLGLGAMIALSLKSYESFALTVAKVKSQTDMSAEGTSRFVGQLQFFHASTDKAGMAVKTLENEVYKLQTGVPAAVAVFKTLGLTWDDLKNLSPDQKLALIRDRLSQIPDPAARSAAATALLGRGAKDMTLWYTASSGAIDKVNGVLEKNHQILSGQQLKDAAAAATAWQGLTGAFKGFEYQVAQKVLPIVTDLVKGLTWIIEKTGPLGSTILPLMTVALGGLAIAFGAVWAAEKIVVMWTTTVQGVMGLWNTVAGIAAVRNGELSLSELLLSLRQKDLAVATGAATIATEGETIAAEGATAAQWLWNIALDANPIGLIIIAIGALALAAIELVKHWRGFVQFWVAMWHDVERAFWASLHFIEAHWKEFTAAFLAMVIGPFAVPVYLILKYWKDIENGVLWMWDHIKQYFWDGVHEVGKAFDWVKQKAEQVWNDIKGIPILGGVINMAVKGVGEVASGIGSAASAVGLAGGGDFVTRGPQLILVGDNPGGRERVKVTPLANGTGGDGVHLHLHASFLAMPSREQLRQVMGMMGEELRLARGALV